MQWIFDFNEKQYVTMSATLFLVGLSSMTCLAYIMWGAYIGFLEWQLFFLMEL
jgi:uncharacterized membrane protein